MPTVEEKADGGDVERPPVVLDKNLEALPPADVGLMPWLQVLGGFICMFNTWGIVVTFGTFQSYYETSTTITATPSAIAWIGSIQTFLLLFIGALCGRLFDAGHLRALLLTGSGLIVFGLMMTSLVTSYYQALLAQGFCVGLGMGCLLIPSVGTPSTWFTRRRGLAVGFVTCGSAVGGVVLPIMLQHLIDRVGFPWAVRVLGFVSLATLAVSVVVMKPRLPPRKRQDGRFFEFTALREPEFSLYATGMLITLLGTFTFYNFVEAWAVATHLPTGHLNPVYLLPITNAASAFGRVIPNYISDKIGPLNVQGPCVFVAGVLMFAWLGVHTLSPLLAVAILYGFFSGGLIGLPPAAVASITPDMTRFGACMGLVFAFMSVGSLVGTPVTGALVQRQQQQHSKGGDGDGYDAAKIWSGVTVIVGAVLMACARMVIARRRGRLFIKV